jgi:hypothetical protein
MESLSPLLDGIPVSSPGWDFLVLSWEGSLFPFLDEIPVSSPDGNTVSSPE